MGNDYVALSVGNNARIQATVTGGSGDDYVELSGADYATIQATVHGGEGYDQVYGNGGGVFAGTSHPNVLTLDGVERVDSSSTSGESHIYADSALSEAYLSENLSLIHI